METLTIKPTFTVNGRTFASEAEAQAYAQLEQRKRQAVEMLSKVRSSDAQRLMSREMSNGAIVALVAEHLEAFAQIVALLKGEVA